MKILITILKEKIPKEATLCKNIIETSWLKTVCMCAKNCTCPTTEISLSRQSIIKMQNFMLIFYSLQVCHHCFTLAMVMLHVSNKDKVYIYMYYVFISIYAKTKLTQKSNWNDRLACTCTNNHF